MRATLEKELEKEKERKMLETEITAIVYGLRVIKLDLVERKYLNI